MKKKKTSYIKKIIFQIIGNVQIYISNIHVRFENNLNFLIFELQPNLSKGILWISNGKEKHILIKKIRHLSIYRSIK